MSEALDSGKEIPNRRESYAPLAEFAAFRDLGFQSATVSVSIARRTTAERIAEVELFSNADLASRPYQALPFMCIF
jgi:hypothetical protein